MHVIKWMAKLWLGVCLGALALGLFMWSITNVHSAEYSSEWHADGVSRMLAMSRASGP